MSLTAVDERVITRAIIDQAAMDWVDIADVDVVVVGAGPSGLTAARYLSKSGLKTVLFEKMLSFGGGIGGGGMLFHKVVVESPADEILREVGCKVEKVSENVFVADSAEMIAKLASAAIDSGVKIILGVTVEDVIYREVPLRITGVVIQWTAVSLSNLHVDPLAVRAKAVIDCTGHNAEVVSIAAKKIPQLDISVKGEGAMFAAKGEQLVVEMSGKVCDGLYVAGMAAAALHGCPRMGPIFGGMLLSGKKVAEQVLRDIKGE
ncbi:MAG: sulfide-dependent adenosine diphosphate thiazole synthase [Candidatus Baldrarchaeia archaeon]